MKPLPFCLPTMGAGTRRPKPMMLVYGAWIQAVVGLLFQEERV
jgi:hypothetical protein